MVLEMAILFAFLPAISFFFQRAMAKDLKKFYKNKMIVLADWLLIPFNFVVIFLYDLSVLEMTIFLSLALVFNIIIHHYWNTLFCKRHKKDPRAEFLSSLSLGHLIFMTIETFLVYVFFFTRTSGIFLILAAIFLAKYILYMPFASKKYHGKKYFKADMIFSLFIIALIILKLVI